ncbi:hypothetical protein M8J76_015228 [Diaphorina citri]|nr:hypothetical protein M8J76_015228 [Diaphorina citri]
MKVRIEEVFMFMVLFQMVPNNVLGYEYQATKPYAQQEHKKTAKYHLLPKEVDSSLRLLSKIKDFTNQRDSKNISPEIYLQRLTKLRDALMAKKLQEEMKLEKEPTIKSQSYVKEENNDKEETEILHNIVNKSNTYESEKRHAKPRHHGMVLSQEKQLKSTTDILPEDVTLSMDINMPIKELHNKSKKNSKNNTKQMVHTYLDVLDNILQANEDLPDEFTTSPLGHEITNNGKTETTTVLQVFNRKVNDQTVIVNNIQTDNDDYTTESQQFLTETLDNNHKRTLTPTETSNKKYLSRNIITKHKENARGYDGYDEDDFKYAQQDLPYKHQTERDLSKLVEDKPYRTRTNDRIRMQHLNRDHHSSDKHHGKYHDNQVNLNDNNQYLDNFYNDYNLNDDEHREPSDDKDKDKDEDRDEYKDINDDDDTSILDILIMIMVAILATQCCILLFLFVLRDKIITNLIFKYGQIKV